MGTPAERLVTDLPIWTDCPFKVPKGFEVRRGKFDDDEIEMIAVWQPRTQCHVDLLADSISVENVRAACEMLKRRESAARQLQIMSEVRSGLPYTYR